MRELIIFFEILKLVPAIIHSIYFGCIRTIQLIAQLQVVWRISKNQIHRVLRERLENLDAVATQDLIDGVDCHNMESNNRCFQDFYGTELIR